MKLLIFSDSHGNIKNMSQVFTKASKNTDAVIHLGDGFGDLEHFKTNYPNLQYYQVVGNCDFEPEEHPFKIITLANKRILLTHGHRYATRSNLLRLSLLAEEQHADICLFGHTHVAGIVETNGVIILNPGSISRPRSGIHPTFGVIEINENGEIFPNITEVL